jgi:hypothetical protein
MERTELQLLQNLQTGTSNFYPGSCSWKTQDHINHHPDAHRDSNVPAIFLGLLLPNRLRRRRTTL